MSLDKLRCAVIGSGFAGTTFAEAIRYVAPASLIPHRARRHS